MIVYSPNSCCCAVCDYVVVLALAAVYVNSLNKNIIQVNPSTIRQVECSSGLNPMLDFNIVVQLDY